MRYLGYRPYLKTIWLRSWTLIQMYISSLHQWLRFTSYSLIHNGQADSADPCIDVASVSHLHEIKYY